MTNADECTDQFYFQERFCCRLNNSHLLPTWHALSKLNAALWSFLKIGKELNVVILLTKKRYICTRICTYMMLGNINFNLRGELPHFVVFFKVNPSLFFLFDKPKTKLVTTCVILLQRTYWLYWQLDIEISRKF